MTKYDPVRGVTVFLLLAFGLAWAAQIALALAVRELPGGMQALGAGVLIAALALMWPPAVAAYVVRRWVERSGFGDAGLRWPSWRYGIIAWLAPPVLVAVVLLISLPLYPFDPTFTPLRELAAQFGQELPAPPALLVLGQLGFALTLAVPINAVFAFGEEFGWRGYLLPRLTGMFGFWRGAALHGAIWGFWHAPLIFLLGYNYPGHNLLGVLLFTVFGVLAGILFAWLQFASGSVAVPTIAHASLNAVAGFPLLVLVGLDAAVGGLVHSPIGWGVLALLIVFMVRRGLLPPRSAEPLAEPPESAG